MMRKTCLLILLVMLSACSRTPEGIEVVHGVEPAKYLGTWYEIARLDHRFERGLEKVRATYSMRDDGGLKVVNRGYDPNKEKWEEAIGKAYFVEPPSADNTYTGKLKVSFFGPFYNGYNILELDKPYYHYVMVCGPNRSYFWILSRTPQLPYPIQQHLIARAREMGFATDQLIYVKQ